MGLMDILNGMQNGPRGAQQPSPSGSSGGGMPTWMMALLGLLAYKAVKGGGLGNILGGGGSAQAPAPAPANPSSSGGGLGDLLGGMLGGGSRSGTSGGGGLGGMLGGAAASGGLGGLLGGLLGGGAGGGALNGGLRNLLQDMEQNGHGDAAQSWVGAGENKSISPGDLANALGADDIDAVSKQTGLPREQMLSDLSQHLPEFVNKLTPDGRVPTDQEASRWV